MSECPQAPDGRHRIVYRAEENDNGTLIDIDECKYCKKGAWFIKLEEV